MPTIGDLLLTGELKRMRESLPPQGRPVLEPSQAVGLKNVKTEKDAAGHLGLCAVRVVRALPQASLDADHPAIGALAIALKHPLADAGKLRLLPAERRPAVERLVQARGGEWSASKLEWQWAVMVGAYAQTPLVPQVSLAAQSFEDPALSEAWDALMDLEVLRAWGLVS